MVFSLKNLGNDILRKIFEYDDTYSEIFTNTVLPSVWKDSWRRWYINSVYNNNPFVLAAIKRFTYTFDNGGFDDYLFRFIAMQYFVSDLSIDDVVVSPEKRHKITLKFKIDGLYACPANYIVSKEHDKYHVESYSPLEG
jgi:hypothetical protein